MNMKHPRRAPRDPLKGAEDRGSKPACAGLDGTKRLRLWRSRGLQDALAVQQSRPGGALGGASPQFDMFALSRSSHFSDLSEEVGGSGSLP